MSNHLKELPAGYHLCPLCHHASRSLTCPRCVPGAVARLLEAVAPDVDMGQGTKRPQGGRKRAGGPNKTEAEYRRKFIDPLAGEIASVLYEAITFRLAAGYCYTPDWIVVGVNGSIEAHEAKGPWQSRDAYIRWCQAAQEWPGIRFFWGKRDRDWKWTMEERNT